MPDSYRIPALLERKGQVDEVRRLIADPRIRVLTVTGMAGVGKSRLAAEAVQDGTSRVVTVDLAELPDAGRVRSVIEAHPEFEATPSILFLDNCDRLVHSLADELPALLNRCPDLTVVTTSRRAFGLYQECLFQVYPLPTTTPDPETPSPAARLLLDSIETRFRGATSADLAIMEQIAAALGGVPLGLELAAAAIARFGAERTLRRIESGQPLPPSPFVDTPARHRTVRDCLEWGTTDLDALSTDLLLQIATSDVLTDLEEVLLLLSGQQRDAIVDRLADLVNRSLLDHAVADNGHYTYAMSGFTRTYLRQLLCADHERALRIRAMRAAGMSQLAARIARMLDDPARRPAAVRLAERWHGDLVATIDYFTIQGEADRAVRMLRELEDVWIERRAFTWAEATLIRISKTADPDAAALGRELLGHWALRSGRFADAVGLLTSAVEPTGSAVWRLAVACYEVGDTQRARTLIGSAPPATARTPREREVGALVEALVHLDRSQNGEGDWQDLRDRIAVLPHRRDRLGLLAVLGRTLLRAGAPHHAHEVFRLALRTPDPARNAVEMVVALEGCARAYHAAGEHYSDHVHRLSAAARWIRDAYALPQLTDHVDIPDPTLDADDPAISTVGSVLDIDEAIAYALSTPPLPVDLPDSPVSRLTKRQLEIARLVTEGMTNRMIASRLGIAEWTVVNHLRQVMTKLDCPSRLHVALVIKQQAQQTA